MYKGTFRLIPFLISVLFFFLLYFCAENSSAEPHGDIDIAYLSKICQKSELQVYDFHELQDTSTKETGTTFMPVLLKSALVNL